MKPLTKAELAKAVTKNKDHPHDKADDEKHLPSSSEIEVFPPLVPEPEPRPAHRLAYAEHLAEKTSEDDERKGGEEDVDPRRLALRLPLAQRGCEKKSARHPCGRYP